ncbi:hypothetical protein GDO78_015261, partial [Eleutherodactylus coqui]
FNQFALYILHRDKVGKGEEDNQQWRMHVTTSMVSHSPVSSVMQLLNTGDRSGFLDSFELLSKRRQSRSHENLTLLPAAATKKGFLPVLPRFLPIFTRGSSCPAP